jgi:hypothetical protein
MTQKEALLFFPLTNEAEIEDLYEDLLFEYKQFFINKFPLKKVFEAKEKKMLQMQKAYILLGGKNSAFLSNFIDTNYNFPFSIKESFQLYQKERNILKNNILKSISTIELSFFIHKLLNLQESYTEKWLIVSNLPDTEIQITNEPDPMSLLNAINEFNSKGGITFDELNSKRNILPDLILNEAKRLSLSIKY